MPEDNNIPIARAPGASVARITKHIIPLPRARWGGPAIEFPAAIERIREIAETPGGEVTDRPDGVNPDKQLLEACAAALALQRLAASLLAENRNAIDGLFGTGLWCDEIRSHCDDRSRRLRRANRDAGSILRAAGKVPARTPAGIYAKALCVRESATGAAVLARSLAADLIANDVLRRLVWPGVGAAS
jgi:hypothetical protein